jgi:hypothetical protein
LLHDFEISNHAIAEAEINTVEHFRNFVTITTTEAIAMDWSGLLKSKRFWLTAATVATVLLKDKIGLTEEQITTLVLAIGAWVVGDSIRGLPEKQ